MIEATAHPNVALIKYWGKSHDALRIPATPSLSIPLLALATTTRIDISHGADEVLIEGQRDKSGRVAGWLERLRNEFGFDVPPLRVVSHSNFPVSAGLASSASGFAALTHAINKLLDWRSTPEALSRLARLGSASAARSIGAGFMALDGKEDTHAAWRAHELPAWDTWPLGVSVAICSRTEKAVSSAKGMRLGRDTSKIYQEWRSTNRKLFTVAVNAIAEQDFETLAAASRWSFFGMLSVMRTTDPPLDYLNATSHAVINAINALTRQGLPVFFTCDAGAQVKCVYLPEHAAAVQECLRRVPGVLEVRQACP